MPRSLPHSLPLGLVGGLPALALASLAAVPPAGAGTALPAARQAEPVRVETVPVAGSIYMLVGRGGNIGVSAGADGILIVDDQFEELAPGIRAALRELSPNPLAFVLNTHWHGDHTGGNVVFGREASIVAHDNVRLRLASPQTQRGREIPAQPDHALPVITYGEAITIHFNGDTIRLLHVPNGHTDGDSVVHFVEDGVVHMGDLFFADRFPYIDLEHGGDPVGMAAGVARVLEGMEEDTHVIPGHGPLSRRADLARYHAMLTTCIDRVRAALAQGMTAEDMVAEGLLADYEAWGSGFISTERFIETLVTALG